MKIPLIIVFFILFSFSKTSALLDSESIWKKVHEYIDNGTIDFNSHYFIFDLKDYANLSKDSKKKNAFVQKQRHLYSSNNILNYLFIVDDFDVNKESIETISSNLVSYIYRDYGIDRSRSIVIFIAIDRRKTRIQIGTNLNYRITDSDGGMIINDMAQYMRNEKYYDAFCKALDEIEYYYNLSPSSSTYSPTSETNYARPILIAILIIASFVGIILCYAKNGCSGNYSDDELDSTYELNRYSNRNNSIGGFLQSDGGYHKSAGASSSGGGGGRHGGGHTGGATGGW